MMFAEQGDKVSVDYMCMADNNVYACSSKKFAKEVNAKEEVITEPLVFRIGDGKLIEGFEKAVIGMQVGEEKTIAVSPEEAYGYYRPELVKKYPKRMFEQNGIKIKHGQRLRITLPSGVLKARVINLDDYSVTLDMNHELAGKTLIFKLVLKEIIK